MRMMIMALVLVACGKSSKPADDNTATGESSKGGAAEGAPAFDCASLLKAEEVESACGAKGSISKAADEGKTETVGSATLKHVCSRDIKVDNGTVHVAIDFATSGDSTEDIVRGGMDRAGSADWAKRTPGMTGYVGKPPAAEGQPETAELHGLVKGTMITMTTTKTETGWPCEDAGLAQLAKDLADRVPAAPSR
jgi:hypothetical protein